MLTLHLALTPTGNQVSVRVNGKESHQFSILELDSKLSNVQKQASGLQSFYKNPRPYGEKLFNALFKDGSPARTEFDALSKQSERTIVLVLESPELDSVAWEYAFNKTKEEYVVEDCAFVRALPENERPANGRLKASYERVPLLFIPANPLVDLSGEPMRVLDEESEWREISKHITTSNAGFDLSKMLPATPEQLQTAMAQFREGLIVHFSGHGGVDDGRAILLFERENGASNPLEAREFVREVKDKAAITFLSACQSAVAERTEFSNLARGLVKAGVPFALGMQFNLPDPFAPDISGQFYNYLTRGHGVPEAARQARRAVKWENEFFVGMIALYAAHPDEAGKLAWRGVNAQTVSLFRPADVSDLPSPASGLIGRQRELMRIGTQLLEGTRSGPLTVTLHGAGGIGKTALLWQALLRFAPSFELTLAIGLDPLPSLESVLGRVELFLGLPSPCSNDTKEREALVRNALTSKRTLLGLDNFETLIHARDNGTNDEKITTKSLYAFFQSLPAAGVTLCVTSRVNTELPGEGEMEEIRGLEDTMGGMLFYEKVGARQRDINVDDGSLEKLSAAVGGHPLALRLLAPIFEEQAGVALNAFVEKLQTYLPQASDEWTEQQRHESLGACFAFSMDNLPKNEEGGKLRVAVSRLSVFAAFFSSVTAAPVIANKWFDNEVEYKTQIDDAERFSHALWERSLLERLTLPLQNENNYLYRLHPALNQSAARYLTAEGLLVAQEIHWRVMCLLASVLFPESQRGGILASPFNSTIARFSMPDMLKAAKLKQDKETSSLLFHIAFLTAHFGDLDGAMRLYQQSLEIQEGLDDMRGKTAALNQMAGIYMMRGDLGSAVQSYQQSLEILDDVGDLQGKSTVLHNIALTHATRGDLDGAIKLYEQALRIEEDLGDLQGKSRTLNNIAQIYDTRGDLDGAIKLYQQSLEILEGSDNLQDKSIVLHNIAHIYATRGDLDGAIKLYQQSLVIEESLGDLHSKSATLNQMAYIYRTRGDLDGAMKLHQQALQIDEGLGDLQGKIRAFANMASILEEDDSQRALSLYSEALDIAQKFQEPFSIANVLGMMSTPLIQIGESRKALELLIEALNLFVQLQAKQEINSTVVRLQNMREKIGKNEFDSLWKQLTNSPPPEWLSQSPQQEQGMTAEQFITGAIQSAREKRPEAEEYFKSAQKMAVNSDAPEEVRALGKVLQRIMLGDKEVDLSSLPKEWAEVVRKTVHE